MIGKKFLPFRRKRLRKTNYKRRLELLKSELPRLVVRTTINNVIVQVVDYSPDGDKIVAAFNSVDLKKFGWKMNTANLPAAYLSGIRCAILAKNKKVAKCVLDTGIFTPVKGSVTYAVVKGFIDAGVEVPCSEEALPSGERVSGKHIEEYTKTLNNYGERFSRYEKAGIKPANIVKHFEEVKKKVMS
ncbi:50S ribosomal protein L18 [Candidatus Woesearchaeota archaeon]|nr:50S ribosomal protein L18 [Candidatus Woesearchaeota archaeon]